MAEPAPRIEASEDRLLGGRVLLRQPRAGFRAAIDSVLLAAAVPAEPGELVFEPGAGAGAAALCLARRVEGCRVVGIDTDAELVRLAGENARLNGLGRAVDIMVGDVASPPARLPPGGFDHAMANPPYLPPERGRPSPVAARAGAAVEGAAGLAAWIETMLRLVRAKGSLTLIHRADRLDALLAALYDKAGEIVVFPLWPGGERPAKRVLVRARKGVATPLRLARGLALHRADGSYTETADAALRGAALVL